MANISLSFRTFDSLLSDLLIDLRQIDEEGLIEPATLIKVAQRVNYDLGLRIHQTKETIIHVDHGYAKLPEDFYVANFALLAGHHKEISLNNFAGRTTEQVTTNCSGDTCCLLPLTYDTNRLNPQGPYVGPGCNPGNPSNACTPEWDPWFQRKCFSTCGGDGVVKVFEHTRHHVREYSYFQKLYLKQQTYYDAGKMNADTGRCGTAEIKNGFLYVSGHENCKVYLSYQGSLEDDAGNLLVLDHPEINFYYLSALTEHIFRNLLYSAGEEVAQKYDRIKQETKEARVRALSIVNMPNFQEMSRVWRSNRDVQYRHYYETFQTHVFDSFIKTLPF